jgi:hypothetical protein
MYHFIVYKLITNVNIKNLRKLHFFFIFFLKKEIENSTDPRPSHAYIGDRGQGIFLFFYCIFTLFL